MLRALVLVLLMLALAGCAGQEKLRHVGEKDDPIRLLEPEEDPWYRPSLEIEDYHSPHPR